MVAQKFHNLQAVGSTPTSAPKSSGSLLIRTPRQGSWKLGLIPRQRKPVDVAELVDALGLGSSVLWRGGSSPLIDIATCAGKINQNAVANLEK